ncbi:enoyl-CoA hydratase-related protein [Neobacillus sp. YX16]|uniref:enoyl-CoA hydratase-related protein n=1 Tax=Neobacillus sp. YX16 TaxID=3047874 RepID=UPI0024C2B7EE|nr:enoyl-CoA hydratase-related protein [Neobacillus sp. YX16]WHZ00886.1 enoyl-CoA hydratase-related protein [Neobacillus sp. YX16]
MEFTDILYQKESGVATLTLNRPNVLNVFRFETIAELSQAFEDADKDPTIGVVILTGNGKAFCCGGDISVLSTLDRNTGREWNRKLVELAMLMRGISKPIIAAINGYTVGGGNELNLFCDLSIASDKAILGQAGPKIGGCPLWGATQLLPRLVGDKRAREIVMLCDQYTAHEALQMGWINKVVPHEELMEAALEFANKILEKAPQSIAYAKLSLNYESDFLYASLTHGGAILENIWGSEQFIEGTNAFKEKRKPNFFQFRQ